MSGPCGTSIVSTTSILKKPRSGWSQSIRCLRTNGASRAHFLLNQMIDHARRSGAYLPYSPNTAYLNTIPVTQQPEYPGDRALERRIEAYIRWNALAMVVRANKASAEYGGHIATYASSATLVRGRLQSLLAGAGAPAMAATSCSSRGTPRPGIYARAFLEGRLTEEQLGHFRREVGGKGLSSYPHPWLMPDFWQFPTVSMGLGSMMAIFQARFLRYLEHRGLTPESDRKVWCFLGDGEMDEPESMGAITMPVREKLDNLIFVINCNLQRLDGPVRGNGKIIQELEAAFGGAGWNVIKVLWGSRWDPLLAADDKGLLRRVMEESVDGEYQACKAFGGAYTRENFFGKYPELKEMVANMSDEEIWRLNRGGHDFVKVYAAYDRAMKHTGGPTVILAKTVKGFGMGASGESRMTAHQAKKVDVEDLKAFRDRFNIPVSDAEIDAVPFLKPREDSDEIRYLQEHRREARRLAAGPRDPGRAAAGAGPGSLQAGTGRLRRPRDLHDDGIRPHADPPHPRSQRRQVRRADRRRRGPHLRHGRHVPAGRHLLLRRPALPPAGRRPAHLLPRGQEGPDPGGGHQRGRRFLLLARRRHELRQQRRAHDSLLHLITRCSASSASATSSGPPATCRPTAS